MRCCRRRSDAQALLQHAPVDVVQRRRRRPGWGCRRSCAVGIGASCTCRRSICRNSKAPIQALALARRRRACARQPPRSAVACRCRRCRAPARTGAPRRRRSSCPAASGRCTVRPSTSACRSRRASSAARGCAARCRAICLMKRGTRAAPRVHAARAAASARAKLAGQRPQIEVDARLEQVLRARHGRSSCSKRAHPLVGAQAALPGWPAMTLPLHSG